jgi:predicted GIY-YIG superfamily endonuclease
MKPFKTIGSILPPPKDPRHVNEKLGIVYQIPCRHCEFVYIGQTKRNLHTRVQEHKRAVKNMEVDKSALCEHMLTFDHIIDWSQAKIITQE